MSERKYHLEERPIADCSLCGEPAIYANFKVFENGSATAGPFPTPPDFILCQNCKNAILKTIGRPAILASPEPVRAELVEEKQK